MNRSVICHGRSKKYNVCIDLRDRAMCVGRQTLAYAQIRSIYTGDVRFFRGNPTLERCFSIETSKGTVMLEAESRTARDEWLRRIRGKIRVAHEMTKIREIRASPKMTPDSREYRMDSWQNTQALSPQYRSSERRGHRTNIGKAHGDIEKLTVMHKKKTDIPDSRKVRNAGRKPCIFF